MTGRASGGQTRPLFVFGTLRHGPLRAEVLGGASAVRPARLMGYRVVSAPGAHYPVLHVASAGEAAEGLLLEGLDAMAQARADFFELGFGYALRDVEVLPLDGAGDPVAARAYMQVDVPQVQGDDATAPAWDLQNWTRAWGEIWRAAAREGMALFGQVDAATLAARWPMIEQRAASRVRAFGPDGQGAPTRLRAGFSAAKDVEVTAARLPYNSYFSLEEQDLRFRRFDGSMSETVRRAGFVGGDAATVLPYDPALDAVLVVEQFRVGPHLRGDPKPWSLEPIAGRVDPGEDPETCVRREAVEEAGIRLGALHRVADYYPSPGAVTEFVYSYVGIADLSGRGGEIGGLEGEHEDIRAHVVGFDDLMELIESGEAGSGPLILTAYWLAARRGALRG